MDGAEFVNQVGEHCRLGALSFWTRDTERLSIYFSDVLQLQRTMPKLFR